MNTPEVESALIAELLEALRALPDVTADLTCQGDSGVQAAVNDVSVSMQVAGRPPALLVGIERRSIRGMSGRHFGSSGMQRRGALAMPAQRAQCRCSRHAESISPGAKDLLKAERVGLLSTPGAAQHLPAPGALFFVDKPPSKSTSRAIRSLFSGRRAHVLHGLLMRREDWLGVTELAEDVSASPSTVSVEVLTELERLRLAGFTGAGAEQATARESACGTPGCLGHEPAAATG